MIIKPAQAITDFIVAQIRSHKWTTDYQEGTDRLLQLIQHKMICKRRRPTTKKKGGK